MRRHLAQALPVLAASFACACAMPPPAEPAKSKPDPSQVVLTTEAVDRAVGEDESEEVAKELGLVSDPELEQYLNAIGQRLVLHAPHRDFTYVFQIVDQEVPNAFALPGGFVYVSRGLLVLTNSEDELANVLCHEIIHVANRHAAGRQEVERTAVNPLMLPGVLVGSVLGEAAGRTLTQPFSIFSAATIASYSRDQEREADRAGQALCAKAGFDPAGMATFLRSLERTERLEEGFAHLPGFLSTHPSTPERVGAAATRGQTLSWNRGPGVTPGRDAYLRHLDGLYVGLSPSEGVFQDHRFLHADLDFGMRFPDGWTLVNTRRTVGAITGRGEAQVSLELSGAGDDPAAAAEEYLAAEAQKLGIGVRSREPLRVNGLPAQRVVAKASMSGGFANVEFTFIAYKGLVYRITGVWPVGQTRYRSTVQAVERSFRPLNPDQRASIRGTVLRLASADGRETLEELSLRSGNAWSPLETAVMNDLFAGARLEADRMVKIAVEEPYHPASPSAPEGPTTREGT